MQLSKTTEYGVRAIVQLARLQPNVYAQTKDLSSGQEKLPAKFLEAVLGHLRHGGLLDSRIGSRGGYRLAKPQHEITVGEVVRILEQRLTRKDEGESMDLTPGQIACRLLNQNLNLAIDRALNGMTVEELMNEIARSGKQQEMYYI